jgi:hypothetical protein
MSKKTATEVKKNRGIVKEIFIRNQRVKDHSDCTALNNL